MAPLQRGDARGQLAVQDADLLAMTVDKAVEFFAHRSIHHALRLLQDVALGYLTRRQPENADSCRTERADAANTVASSSAAAA